MLLPLNSLKGRALRLILLAIAMLTLTSCSRQNETFEGVVNWRFEVSAFYPNGDCSSSPYWFTRGRRRRARQTLDRAGQPEVCPYQVRWRSFFNWKARSLGWLFARSH